METGMSSISINGGDRKEEDATGIFHQFHHQSNTIQSNSTNQHSPIDSFTVDFHLTFPLEIFIK